MDEKLYLNLLDRAWDALPEKLKHEERFEMPEARIFREGNYTIIQNFNEISDRLGRGPNEILKFLLKELAAPGSLQGARAVIQRTLNSKMVNSKLSEYAREYVICHECSRPDTVISEFEGQKIIRCNACGAWWSYRRIK